MVDGWSLLLVDFMGIATASIHEGLSGLGVAVIYSNQRVLRLNPKNRSLDRKEHHSRKNCLFGLVNDSNYQFQPR